MYNEILGRVWKVSSSSPLSTDDGQAIFFAFTNRVLDNRLGAPGQYKHAKSPRNVNM